MKAKRSITCTLLAVTLMFGGASVNASASSITDTPQSTTKNVDGFIIEEFSPIDLSNINPENIVELSQTREAMLEEETELSQELELDTKNSELNITDFENAKDLSDIIAEDSSKTRAGAPYQMFTLSDVIAAGDANSLYTVEVQNGQILQVELQVPRNLSLDYDLSLYELNEAGTELTRVSLSQYGTDSNFMPESTGVINNSGRTIIYYIMVNPNGNPSTTEYYTLTGSIGNSSYDEFEPNESAFYALQFPTMTVPSTLTVPANLNTPIDNDWFSVNVDTSSYKSLEVKDIPDSVVVESYRATDGLKMVKTGSTANGSTLPMSQGFNYIRVKYNGTGAFSPIEYTINFSTTLTAAKTLTLIAVDGYCQRYSGNFDDGTARGLFTMGSNIEVRVMYLTTDNYLVKVADRVDVVIENPAWSNDYMKYKKGNATINDANTCSVFLKPPAIYGNATTRYNSVYTTITSEKFGTIARNAPMAVIDKYDNGEIDKPCIHDGTCGLK